MEDCTPHVTHVQYTLSLKYLLLINTVCVCGGKCTRSESHHQAVCASYVVIVDLHQLAYVDQR